MGTPVDAFVWSPSGNNPVYEPSPSTPPAAASGSTTYHPTGNTYPASGTPFQGYTASPLPSQTSQWRPLLSDELTNEGRSLGLKAGHGQNKDDPRAAVISFSRLAQEVDTQLDVFLGQPIDLDAAQRDVTAADQRQTRFLEKVYAGLKPHQTRTLRSLAQVADQGQGPEQQAAQAEFIELLDEVLTPEQRTELRGLERAYEDAYMNLQGQQIVKRINDARAGGGDTLSLALADGRAFVADRMRVMADRKVQDVYAIIIPSHGRQKLEGPQRELLAAMDYLQRHPGNAAAMGRLETAKKEFDAVFNQLVHPQDREALVGYEAWQREMQTLAGTFGDEADSERAFYDLRTLAEAPGATTEQRRIFEFARAQFEITKHNRNMRSLAVRAGSGNDDDLNAQLDAAMTQSWRMSADLNVQRQQLELDHALLKHDEWTKTAMTANPVGNTTGGPSQIPPTQQAVLDAQRLLDVAKKEREEFEQALTPPATKKSGWDRALDILVAVGEIVGGVVLMAMAGWTGIGAVAGGAIVVDGLFRLGHSISDAANGTVTDTPQSRLMQNMGMSRDMANRVDTGVSVLATAPIGGWGAGLTVVRSTSMLLKGSGALGGLLVIDGAQAGLRYSFTGKPVAPWSVTQLTNAGLTPTQANYVLAAGNFIGMAGLATGAARRTTGPVRTEYHAFNGADADGAIAPGTHVADWYSRGAPKEVRQTVATQVLGPDAAPRAVNKLSNSFRGNPLVVVRAAGEDTILGGASIRTNSPGRFGRDQAGGRVGKGSAEIKHIAGEGLVKQEAIAAATVGVENFTRQNVVFWHTLDAEDSNLVPTATIKTQRVRRDAAATFAQLPEDARPWGVTKALEGKDPTQPLSTREQLRNIAKMEPDNRINWPAGTQALVYQVTFERPLSVLGSHKLGRLVHPMHKDSYVGAINRGAMRLALKGYEKLRPSPSSDPKVIATYWPPEGKSAPPRVATLYRPGVMRADPLREVASADVRANEQFGELGAVGRLPPERRVPVTQEKLGKKELIKIEETEPLTGKQTLVAGASITRNFKGFGHDVGAFPFLARRRYRPGTTYLSDVFSEQPGGGTQVVLAAEQAARSGGARYFDFLTQWRGAQQLYAKLGAHAPDEAAPAGAKLPNLVLYEARVGNNAGELLFGKADQLPEPLQPIVREAPSAQALQRRLESMSTDELRPFAGQMPDGVLLTNYRIDYGRSPASRWRQTGRGLQVAGWYLHQKVWTPATHPVVWVKNHAWVKDTAVPWVRDGYEAVNPYALRDLERGAAYEWLRTAGYAVKYGASQSWTTWRGAVIDAGLVQAATGNVHIVRNDDRAIRPFNGLPGSESVAIYFPWTGTLLAVWGVGPHYRLPWPVDPDSGLQPLARASAPLTDPRGPKGAGGLHAARVAGLEGSIGIRWFGGNSGASAVTAASIRLLPINLNGRVDVPIERGAATNAQFVHSLTGLMPSLSHAFYYDQYGVIVRSVHVTLTGSAQAAALSPAARAAAYRSGSHWTFGSKDVTTGTGYFITRNPAYGQPNFSVG